MVDRLTGETTGYGGIHEGEKVRLVVKKDTFWVRLFLFADMGFAESFMLGEVECVELTAFFKVSTEIPLLLNDESKSGKY